MDMKVKTGLLLSLVLLISVSAALTGCIDEEEEPQTELVILEEEYRDEDTEGSSPETGHRFYWIHVELKNEGDSHELHPDERYFILETVEGEEYVKPQEEGMSDTIEPGKSEDF
ncbi:MAG: hypothetical protein ACLFVL_01710 [Candidatus Aenigmatarchaeota archaeon]